MEVDTCLLVELSLCIIAVESRYCAGAVLSAEQARWPFSQLKHLGLYKTHVTGECLPHLEHLEGLRFLDARSAHPC